MESVFKINIFLFHDCSSDGSFLFHRPDSKLHLIVPLKGYDIPFSLRLAVNQGKLDEKLLGLLESEVTMSMPQYSQKFSTLLHIEELQMEVDIRHYDMEDATLVPDDQRRGHLALKVI